MSANGKDFEVRGTVTLDTEELSRGVKRAGSAIGQAGAKIANSFKERLLSVLGAGGIAFLLKKQLGDAFEAVKESAKLGIAADELMALKRISETSGVSVEELSQRFLEAKTTGTGFASDVTAAMKDMRERGLLPANSEIQAMSDAYLSLADSLAKVTPLIAAAASATADTINSITGNKGGAAAGILENLWNTAKVVAGSAVEGVGQLASYAGMSGVGSSLQTTGHGMQAGVAKWDETPKTETETDKLVKRLREQQSLDAWWKSIGGEENWSSSPDPKKQSKSAEVEVSDLRRIGGYSTSGSSFAPAEEQLRLLNRKVDDLVATAKRVEL
jgi:hypothetical protein